LKFNGQTFVGNGVPKSANTQQISSSMPKTVDAVSSIAMIKETGSGVPSARAKHKGQKKLTACRAARIDAMRKLRERLGSSIVSSDSKIVDMASASDVAKSRLEGALKQVREVSTPRYSHEDEICEVDMEAPLIQ
ncbi:hypothetical protein, partial [Candidatus Venteria ishoeyi]